MHATVDYGQSKWIYMVGARRNCRKGGGGASTKKAPHMEKKVAERHLHGEKEPHEEKK